MMRELTLVDSDGVQYTAWVNSDLVMSVRPVNFDRTHCWLRFANGSEWRARGAARDIALELNGHYDE